MSQLEEMKRMIRNEMQSIEDLSERRVLRELMERVFLPLYETNERMYQQLEDRVMEELTYDVNRYLIKTGLTERQFLDPTHPFMTVMQEQDWQQKALTIKEIRQAIDIDRRCFLGTVVLKCDFLDIQGF